MVRRRYVNKILELRTLSKPLTEPLNNSLVFVNKPLPTSFLFRAPLTHHKQADKGLWGDKFRNRYKNYPEPDGKWRKPRVWVNVYPNIQWTKFFSNSLNRYIKIKCSQRIVKTITKYGGIDAYLTRDKQAHRAKLGVRGTELRNLILNSDKIRETWRQEMIRLGRPKSEIEKPGYIHDPTNPVYVNERRELKYIAEVAKKMARKKIKKISQLGPKLSYPKPTFDATTLKYRLPSTF